MKLTRSRDERSQSWRFTLEIHDPEANSEPPTVLRDVGEGARISAQLYALAELAAMVERGRAPREVAPFQKVMPASDPIRPFRRLPELGPLGLDAIAGKVTKP